MLMEIILNKKRYVSSSRVFNLKKKSVQKLLKRTMYVPHPQSQTFQPVVQLRVRPSVLARASSSTRAFRG